MKVRVEEIVWGSVVSMNHDLLFLPTAYEFEIDPADWLNFDIKDYLGRIYGTKVDKLRIVIEGLPKDAPVYEWVDQIHAIGRSIAKNLNLNYDEFTLSSTCQDLYQHVEGWLMGAWDAVQEDIKPKP